MTFLRICTRELDRNEDNSEKIRLLEERVRMLEKGIVSSGKANADLHPAAAKASENVSGSPQTTAVKEPAAVQSKSESSQKAVPPGSKPFDEWDSVMEDLRKNRHMIIFSNLLDARAVWKDENTISIVLQEDEYYKKQILIKSENIEIITESIRRCTGKNIQAELFKLDKKEKIKPKDEIPEKVLYFAEKTGLKLDIVDE
jgi:hypothetical protein